MIVSHLPVQTPAIQLNIFFPSHLTWTQHLFSQSTLLHHDFRLNLFNPPPSPPHSTQSPKAHLKTHSNSSSHLSLSPHSLRPLHLSLSQLNSTLSHPPIQAAGDSIRHETRTPSCYLDLFRWVSIWVPTQNPNSEHQALDRQWDRGWNGFDSGLPDFNIS